MIIFFCFSSRFLSCSNHVQNTTLKVFHFRNEPIGQYFTILNRGFVKQRYLDGTREVIYRAAP